MNQPCDLVETAETNLNWRKEVDQKAQLQLVMCIRRGSRSNAVFFSLAVSRAELVVHTDLAAGLGLGRDKQLGKEGENFGLVASFSREMLNNC